MKNSKFKTRLRLLGLGIFNFTFLILNCPATSVFFPVSEMSGSTNDVTINVKAVNNPVIWNGRFYYQPKLGTNLATVGGYVTNSFIPGIYTVTIAGLNKSWTMGVTNAASELSAVDLSQAITVYSGLISIAGVNLQVVNDGLGNITITDTNSGGSTSFNLSTHTNLTYLGLSASARDQIETNAAWQAYLATNGWTGGSGANGMFTASAGRLTAASNELAATTGIFNAVQANTFSGSGAALYSLNGSQVTSGMVTPDYLPPGIITNNDTRTITLASGLRGNNIRSTNSLYVDDAKLTSASGRLLAEQGFQGRGIYLFDAFDVYIFPTNPPAAGQILGIAPDLIHTWWINAVGSGDLLAVNNLAELSATKATARKNLGTDDAASITNGVLRLLSVPSLPASQITNAAKAADWNFWTDGTTYFAQNKLQSSTLSSNNFSGLLQTVVSASVSGGFSTKFHFASGTDAASSASNRYYWFTNTVYVTNGSIFAGEGNAATVFAASPALTGPLLQLGADGNFLSGIVRFENIRFHGDAGAALSTGLKFRNVAEPNVLNCEFNGFQFAGIWANNTNYNHWSQVLHCWFVGGAAGSHCVLIDSAPVATTCRMQIRDCDFEPHGGAAVTVSNHFRNLSIIGSSFGDSSGTSTAAIQVYAGNGFQFIGNNFAPFWGSTVLPIYFGNRASATNINADVSHNMANGLTTQNLIWIGTNVQGVSMIGNQNPGGNVVTNGSGGNSTYVRVDREVIRTDGDITAGGAVSGATASFGTQSNTVLNVGNIYTVLTNAATIGTDANGKIQVGSGSGTGSTNMLDVLTNSVYKGNLIGTNLGPSWFVIGGTNRIGPTNAYELQSGTSLLAWQTTNGVVYSVGPPITTWAGPTNNITFGYPIPKYTYTLTSDASITNALGIVAGAQSGFSMTLTNSTGSNCSVRLSAPFKCLGSVLTNQTLIVTNGTVAVLVGELGSSTNLAAVRQSP